MGNWPALLLSSVLPLAAGVVELLGKTMPPYPDGLREVGGACLSDSTDSGHVCDYSIGLLADVDADPDAEPVMRYVIAGRLVGRDGGSALWKVTDAQAYPKAAKGFFWQAGTCRVDKVEDPNLIAVVQQGQEQEYLTEVIWARRLELKNGQFAVIDPARVDCINEGYGEQ